MDLSEMREADPGDLTAEGIAELRQELVDAVFVHLNENPDLYFRDINAAFHAGVVCAITAANEDPDVLLKNGEYMENLAVVANLMSDEDSPRGNAANLIGAWAAVQEMEMKLETRLDLVKKGLWVPPGVKS